MEFQFVEDVESALNIEIKLWRSWFTDSYHFIISNEGQIIIAVKKDGQYVNNFNISSASDGQFGNHSFPLFPDDFFLSYFTSTNPDYPFREGLPNHFTVVAIGGDIVFFVNGGWIASLHDPTPHPSGECIFGLINRDENLPARVHVDNLRIWDISDMDFEFTVP